MRFVERLTTSAVQRERGEAAPGVARAALPARFAPRPNGRDALPADDASTRWDRAQTWPPAADAQPSSATSASDPRRQRVSDHSSQPARATPATAAHAPAEVNVTTTQGRRRVAQPAHAEPVEDSQASIAESAQRARGEHEAARVESAPQAAARTVLDRAATTVMAVMAATTATGAARAQAVAPTGHSALAAAASPLRESTLAARLASARDDRPIIHVTIDRIDVRAPAAPSRAAPPPARTTQAPSVPLADYLRGRGRSGGAS